MQFDTPGQYPAGEGFNPNSNVVPAPHSKLGMLRKVSVKKLATRKVLIVLLVLAFIASQAAILYFVINPPYLYQQNLSLQIVSELVKITTIKNPMETPQIAIVADVDKLKADNAIQAQVYKDAQNGDYVVAYTNEMIIYRRQSGKVIYQGDSPVTIANTTQQQISDAVVSKAKTAEIIAADSQETPQLSVVTDVDAVKSQSPEFYADVQQGDVIAIFPEAKKIVLYRNATGQIVKFGSVNTNIQ